MRRALLTRTHPELDATLLQRYRDLFIGGEDFMRRCRRYLPQHEREPDAVYERRCKTAHYLNYCSPIGGYFSSLLFSKQLSVRLEGITETPEEDENFLAAVDGKDSLSALLRRGLLEAMQVGAAYYLVEFPAATGRARSRADWEQANEGTAQVIELPRESLINWRSDRNGWLWVTHFSSSSELLDPSDERATITETWTTYYRDGSVRRWQQVRLEGDDISSEDIVPEVPAPVNPTGQIPIVALTLPPDLWLMRHLADAQLEQFRKRQGLSWSIERTCYAMPVFKLKSTKRPPTMGAGYYIMLGVDEDATYLAPPDAPYAQIAGYIATLKDEIHRVSTTMALGVENNAAAVGRSGESKAVDAASTEVVLDAYGRLVMDAAKAIVRLRDRGLGLDREWCAEGLHGYTVDDAKTVAEAVAIADGMHIPSVTLKRRMYQRLGKALVPNLSAEDERAIAEEIEDGVTPEDMAAAKEAADAMNEDQEADPVGEEG